MNFGKAVRALFFRKKVHEITLVPESTQNFTWRPDEQGTILRLVYPDSATSAAKTTIALSLQYASGSPEVGDEIEIQVEEIHSGAYYRIATFFSGTLYDDVESQRLWKGVEMPRIFKYGHWGGSIGGASWKSVSSTGINMNERARAQIGGAIFKTAAGAKFSGGGYDKSTFAVSVDKRGQLMMAGVRDDTGEGQIFQAGEQAWTDKGISEDMTGKPFKSLKWLGSRCYLGTDGSTSVDRVGVIESDFSVANVRDLDQVAADIYRPNGYGNSRHVILDENGKVFTFDFSNSYEFLANATVGTPSAIACGDQSSGNNGVAYVTYEDNATITAISVAGVVSVFDTVLSSVALYAADCRSVGSTEGEGDFLVVVGRRSSTNGINCFMWLPTGERRDRSTTRGEIPDSTSAGFTDVYMTPEYNLVALMNRDWLNDSSVQVVFSSDFGETWTTCSGPLYGSATSGTAYGLDASLPRLNNTNKGDLVYTPPSGYFWDNTYPHLMPSIPVFPLYKL